VHGITDLSTGVFGEATSTQEPSQGIGVSGRSDAGIALFGMIGPPPMTHFDPGVAGVAVYGFSNQGAVAVFDSNANIPTQLAVFRVRLDDNSPFLNVARIDLTGRGFFDGGTQTGGADIAEFITSQDVLQPGDLVEIDADRPGQFRLATRHNSTAIAGVVSTNPGVIMNGTNSASQPEDLRPRLALAGCAPVKVTAENGPVKPGDLLVASRKPGHAMRAPPKPAPGTIVGKALGPLGEATGVIDMLVMLR
jgi:hypothetical protein